uniref:Mitochondrial ribosomal protein L35 n=1 Tax=Rattus norvegicus TaxID=10116 RepID=A0ABK0LDD6_RAT
MAASIFMGAVRAASGILRPLNVSVSSTYRNCARNACLSSALRTIPFRHIQTSVVSSAPRLVKSVGHLAYGHTASVLNRVATLVPSVLKPPVRALTYCSARKGKRKTVKSVVHRFLRLHSGLWLRRKRDLRNKLEEMRSHDPQHQLSQRALSEDEAHLPPLVILQILCKMKNRDGYVMVVIDKHS